MIVTNNPLLRQEDQVLFIDGTFRDVLIAVRDNVYEGYELISHPLFASSRMMFSPFRTVIIGRKEERISEEACQIVEDAIRTYDRLTARRQRQPEHDADYAWLDRALFLTALAEHESRFTQ